MKTFREFLEAAAAMALPKKAPAPRCAFCGGPHETEEHGQHTPRPKKTVAADKVPYNKRNIYEVEK